MTADILLAISAAVVTIVGIAYDPKDGNISLGVVKSICKFRDWSLRSAIPRVLVVGALTICVFAIVKSVSDERDKEFMKAAITETLPTTPDVINQVYLQIEQVAKHRYTVSDYSYESDGMVIFLQEPSKEVEALVLSASELANIRAKLILRDDPSTLLSSVLDQKFSFADYSEDLYARLCALFSVSGRQVLFKKPIDCDYDSKKGITLTVNVNNVEQQVNLSVDEIKKYEGQGAKTAFGAMNAALREKVAAIVNSSVAKSSDH